MICEGRSHKPRRRADYMISDGHPRYSQLVASPLAYHILSSDFQAKERLLTEIVKFMKMLASCPTNSTD